MIQKNNLPQLIKRVSMSRGKLTILFFIAAVTFINFFLFIAISLYHQEAQAGFYFTLWYQVAGLFDIAHTAGIDVMNGPSEFLPSPNILGWLLIVVNCSIVMMTYCIISKKIATFWINRY